jgi:hypothetical protein
MLAYKPPHDLAGRSAGTRQLFGDTLHLILGLRDRRFSLDNNNNFAPGGGRFVGRRKRIDGAATEFLELLCELAGDHSVPFTRAGGCEIGKRRVHSVPGFEYHGGRIGFHDTLDLRPALLPLSRKKSDEQESLERDSGADESGEY